MGVGAIETTPLERVTAAIVIGAGSWIGVNWILALTHTFTRATLLIALAMFVIAAVILLPRYFRLPKASLFTIAVLIPLALWVAFVCWRGVLLPPDNHDALAYHFPKAVFIAENHGYGYFVTGDPRVTVLPANYELLLADVLVLTGTDHITEWINTFFYLSFLIATGASIERWFGSRPAVVATIIATAATPVLLLHSGADKNDLMTCFFCICALLWGAGWYVHGGTRPWVLTVASMVLAGGTKPHAAAVLAGLAPFLIAGAIRHRPSLRNVAYTIMFAIAAFAVGGGAVYAVNFSHAHDKASAIGTTPNFIGYGDWANWYRVPYMLLAEPFSREPLGVYVPWLHQWWFWPRYELFFSGYGPLFTILVVIIPYCVYRFRDRIDERFAFAVAALIAAFLTMPLQFRPLGFFGGLPRFIAFVIPAVMGYSIAPFFAHVPLRTAKLLIVALAVYFSYEAFQCGYRDRFSPWIYVRRAMREHVRWVWISPWRAGNALDRIAGAHDVVAVDCSFDTWIYLAMGEYHTRRLEFLKAGAVQIPSDAQWVMVDRTWNLIWGDPRLTDMSQAFAAMFAWKPTVEDTRVIRALWNDPHWKLVYYRPRLNQAIFQRR